MSSSDYHLHIDRAKWDSLWEDDGSEGFPFGEDDEEIQRAIDEEIKSPRRRRKRQSRR